MNICKKCIWAKFHNQNLVFCMFPKCIMKVKVIEDAKETKKTVLISQLP